MLSLSDNNQTYFIEAFNSTSRYLENYFIYQLLYGIEDSTWQENKTLLIYVQQFLISCGRSCQRREPIQARAH